METAASTAPPPGTTDFDSRTRLMTQRESWRDLSISSKRKSLAPLKMMLAEVLAFGLGIKQKLCQLGITDDQET